MKEYTLYLRHGKAMPFTFSSFKTFESAKAQLYSMIQTEIERGRPFYVDNDFFDNKYDLGSNLYYMCIMEREVGEWHKFSQTVSDKRENKKIKYFCNYI